MTAPFSAVLLAGGKSSRMGCDKAFVEIDSVPLWRRQMRLLRELDPAETFIAGPAHPEWIEAGYAIVLDAQQDAGPLAGLVASLRRCSTSRLVTLAVDLPNMTCGYLRQLLGACSNGQGIVPKNGDRFEPLAAVYPKATLPIAERLLASGRYSLQKFARRCIAEGLLSEQPIRSDDDVLFLNMNTPEDLRGCRPGLPTRRACDVASPNTSLRPRPAASGDAAYIP